ncbi:unnamed protein product [Ceratitis capitata]|uniref:(Mediterranean fruit fly) hypothetical protein n=1 Tax=Ceratitis capitata TaxID=7213 RepID=A0A811U836_CERCA|nr:unnamed protein product [Ceratitis capitata]
MKTEGICQLLHGSKTSLGVAESFLSILKDLVSTTNVAAQVILREQDFQPTLSTPPVSTVYTRTRSMNPITITSTEVNFAPQWKKANIRTLSLQQDVPIPQIPIRNKECNTNFLIPCCNDYSQSSYRIKDIVELLPLKLKRCYN